MCVCGGGGGYPDISGISRENLTINRTTQLHGFRYSITFFYHTHRPMVKKSREAKLFFRKCCGGKRYAHEINAKSRPVNPSNLSKFVLDIPTKQ